MKRAMFALMLTALLGWPVSAQSQRLEGADPSALERPISPLSKPLSALRGDPRVYDTVPPPRNNVWQQIQEPLERSYRRMGVIEDASSAQLRRIEQTREERSYSAFRRREFDRFQWERDRALDVEELQRRTQRDVELARRRELDRREYLLYLNAEYSPLAEQVERDRLALVEAKARRDRELYQAALELDEALRQPGAERQALQNLYEQKRRDIRTRYEQTRSRILGY